MTPTDDPVVLRLAAAAQADASTLGFLIQGSRAAGHADAESDYDVVWVLADDELARRDARGERAHVRESRDGAVVDLAFTSPTELRKTALTPGWWTYGYATARVVLDKTGELAELHALFARIPDERVHEEITEAFDGYLNSFYRSLKAWRRGDELAGRMEAAESLEYAVQTLFALERRWPPYPNRLREALPSLAGEGWPPGYLERVALELLKTGSPRLQQELEEQVERLLRARGFESVVESWHGEIERVKVFRF